MGSIIPLYGCFQKLLYPKMDGLYWKTLLTWMIWGYHYFRKHLYILNNPGVLHCSSWRLPDVFPSRVPKPNRLRSQRAGQREQWEECETSGAKTVVSPWDVLLVLSPSLPNILWVGIWTHKHLLRRPLGDSNAYSRGIWRILED